MARTIEDLDLGTHTCLVPDSVEHSREVAAAWLAGGLSAGERVMYFEDDTAGAVLDRLADDRVPVERALTDGQFVLVPGEATRAASTGPLSGLAEMMAGVIRESEGLGWPGLRMTSETPNLQIAMGLDFAVAYESIVDRVLREHPTVRLLCRYERRLFDEETLDAVRAVHESELITPAVYDDGLLRVTRPGPGRLRLAGEADHSNRPVIRRVLDTALDSALRSDSAPRDIVLDLASLRFVDVSGVVGLVHTAEEFPDSHRLVLTGVRPRVLRALERCGAGSAQRLAVEPRRHPDGSEHGHG
jgi:anti-anti-sigma factor